MIVYIEGFDNDGNPVEETRELDSAIDNTNPTKLGYIIRALCTKNNIDPATITYIEVKRPEAKRPAGSPPL